VPASPTPLHSPDSPRQAEDGQEDRQEAERTAGIKERHLASLNSAQREAAEHGVGGAAAADERALLVIAGAGSGKTNTLAHRVAHLVHSGVDPQRILLLTFTRRAAAEMTRRAQRILATTRVAGAASTQRIHWSGTFHALANRLLRLHADSVGLDPGFTVLDRTDSADLMDVLRNDLLSAAPPAAEPTHASQASQASQANARRFPRKATCLAIYSHCVNSQRPLAETLAAAFPWCGDWEDELCELFAAYVDAKQRQSVLDYDDLLLYWHALMEEPLLADSVRERFDHVLVDEYQDTNALQAGILLALRPSGSGLTVVGDDAQAIYSFRAATVRNILDFPQQFQPPARVVMLERNYRATQPLLDACNAVIDQARERFCKRLYTTKASHEKPWLVTAEDELAQVDYVIERVLAQREAGIPLQRQAVLMRAGHHGDPLEIELGRRGIPYVKYGGLKFLEAAHVKDMLCVLRWAENPRDGVAGFRVLQLLPGIGPQSARRALDALGRERFQLQALSRHQPPPAARTHWSGLCELLQRIASRKSDWPAQLGWVRDWYEPHLERLYDSAPVRAADLEQLEQISASYPSRERFLVELTLDPPSASGDEAGPPLLDEDFLVLSTIHSAKGQEWDAVFVLNVVDGCIPSDLSTGKPEEIEEERRLLYVAMTRAREHLHLIHPQRMFIRQQHRHGDRHVYAPRSRFLPDTILGGFERVAHGTRRGADTATPTRPALRVDVGARLRERWRGAGPA
jgi:DNA helicase-2/ATP-dependent DNA helicase PcrA